MREWRFFGQYWASQISVPCQIFVSWVDYVLKIFSNKPIIFINRGFLYQVLMMVIMEIILWIKCIIFFFLYFHYVSGFCWRTNFLISVWKKIYFTSPFHHDFKGVNNTVLSMSPPKVIQVATKAFQIVSRWALKNELFLYLQWY